MSNLLQDSAAWLAGQMKNSAGRTVTYRRSDGLTAALTGWPAKLDYEIDDEQGIPRKVTLDDWSFEAADLVFAGETEQFEPRAGDRFTETLSGYDVTYEVMPLPKRPIAEWPDTAGVMRLVHTKLVKRCPQS